MTTCPTCSKPLGNDRFCIGPLTAPHPAVFPFRDPWRTRLSSWPSREAYERDLQRHNTLFPHRKAV